ncbi:hypothetical protein [Streptomyces sp. SCL15-6]|uniref:hypothetical protein n=1 Tax=Streptomyces sp. SCL15-6 TaxID=2967222 RepID=UPI002965E591|nr:hypothetical protein [Streptomyces sp. SCL15-6]
MAHTRYDQRVRVFVQVCGGEHDWREAEARFEAHGWPVRDAQPAGSGPLGAALEPDPASRVYELEVRLFGTAKGSDRGAADRVRKVLRAAHLEGYVRRAEPVERDRELFPHWRVVSTAHRRPGRQPAWRRHLTRAATRLGRHDTGGFVAGGPRQALRLARADAPAGGPRPAVAVRPLDGRRREPAPYRREEQLERSIYRLVLWTLLSAGALTLASAAIPGAPRWILGTLALFGACGSLWSGWDMSRAGKRQEGVFLALLCLLIFAAFGMGLLSSDGKAWTPRETLTTAVVVSVLAGLWLLVRQWTWGEWVAWAVPLAVTLTVSAFVAAGSVLHALYADGLSLSPGDLDVPPVWQFAAAVKLLVMLSLVMIVPAWWGFAKHRHHRYATPGDGTNIILNVCLFVAMLAGAGLQAWDSAATAVDRTVAAAGRGEDPPSYFGVEPEWTCVRLVVPAGELAGEGPPLKPGRPYLSFGVAGETAVLWDPATREPVKLPANQVWLGPAESGSVTCPGRPPAKAKLS